MQFDCSSRLVAIIGSHSQSVGRSFGWSIAHSRLAQFVVYKYVRAELSFDNNNNDLLHVRRAHLDALNVVVVVVVGCGILDFVSG